jgi:hypothetical protein
MARYGETVFFEPGYALIEPLFESVLRLMNVGRILCCARFVSNDSLLLLSTSDGFTSEDSLLLPSIFTSKDHHHLLLTLIGLLHPRRPG